MLSSMLILMGGAAVAPSLPLISDSYPEASEWMISMIITLPSLSVAFSGFIIGVLADRIGRLPVLVSSLAIFTLAGTSGFYLHSLEAILIGRFILGIGIAGIATGTTALITDYYKGMTKTRVLGYQGAAMGVGILVLETSGGLLAGISWRISFLIYLIGLFIMAGVLLTMKEPERAQTPVCDINKDKAGSKHSGNPECEFIPYSTIIMIYMTLFLTMLMFFLMPTKFPYFMSELAATTGLTESGGIFANASLVSGLFLGLMGCASSIIGVIYWRIAAKMHRMSILVLSYFMYGSAFIILGYSSSLAVAGIAVILAGIGSGLVNPTILNWLTFVTPQHVMGKIMGGFSVALNLGQFVSALIVVPILAAVGTYGNMFIAYSGLSIFLGVLYLIGYLKMKVAVRLSSADKCN
ncbi:MFS family permease [Methanomicrobium sp. W14]|uniref:MFS transporter n=1 Tax=Methanomicrobium sp. W14 TaxID=2817839 RepID=UPI001FD9FB18|nr:MFS transporter [Methanomicrobium sp. W14]MBP2134017.1 MFS family permease [Methanomicrobium sp. W14]